VPGTSNHYYVPATDKTVHWGYFSKLLKPLVEVSSGDFVTVETLTHHANDDADRMGPEHVTLLVLADGFQSPVAVDVTAQNRSDASMNVYVNALSQRASSDIKLESEGKMPNTIPGDEIIIHWKRRWAVTVAGIPRLLRLKSIRR